MIRGATILFLAILLTTSMVSGGLLVTKGIEDIHSVLNSENLCVDTDANKDRPEFKRGYVQDINGVYWDECNSDFSGPDLIERVCEDGFVRDMMVNCEKGCYLGACVKYSFFPLPKRTYLPISEKFLSLQRFMTSRFAHSNGGVKYELNLLNLIGLNDIFADIDKRLTVLEKKEVKVFPLVVRLTKLGSLDTPSDVESMIYFRVDYADGLKVEEAGYEDLDLELFAEGAAYDLLKSLINNPGMLEKTLKGLYSSDKIKVVALSEKGRSAKNEGLKLI